MQILQEQSDQDLCHFVCMFSRFTICEAGAITFALIFKTFVCAYHTLAHVNVVHLRSVLVLHLRTLPWPAASIL